MCRRVQANLASPKPWASGEPAPRSAEVSWDWPDPRGAADPGAWTAYPAPLGQSSPPQSLGSTLQFLLLLLNFNYVISDALKIHH